jgi:glycosyltransferase involved in cell wall biosynthesis
LGTSTPAMPRVSILLSAKNEERYLPSALDSISKQTFADWECLIFDDGSTDRTLEIAEEFSQRDARFRVFNATDSSGLAVRLNQLVLQARGTYVARMDADDEMLPDRLSRQIAVFDALDSDTQNSTVLGGSVVLIDGNGKQIGERAAPARATRSSWQFPPVLHPTVFARTSWFRKFPYDESTRFQRAEDSELWVRAMKTTKFRNTLEPVLRYRTIGTFEPARFIRSQKAMIRIGLSHHSPSLLARGTIGVVAGMASIRFKPIMRLAMRMRRLLVGEKVIAHPDPARR